MAHWVIRGIRLLAVFSQSPWNRGKSTQTCFRVSVAPCFQLRKSDRKIGQNHKTEIVCFWVEASNFDYEQSKKNGVEDR
ncbi:hypothetical protein ES706_06393 [subsurface metagenome]